MIQKAIAQFARFEACESIHLPFFFTPDVKSARQGGLSKVLELVRVIGRLVRIRNTGPIDLFLYPVGGPQTVPMVRDLLLLPWVLLVARRVVLHFHAAGISEQIRGGRDRMLARLLALVYRRAFAAIVMTNFNRRDPEAIGITRIAVVPHRIEDNFDPQLLRRGQGDMIRFLYVGHLCPDKGTPELLQAFATLQRSYGQLELELVGECLPPFSQVKLDELLDSLQIRSRVRVRGVLTGQNKVEAFARADLFLFPSVAPYESFGLVLIEAMAWKLPIVASKWRGNSDVLTARAGAISFPVSTSLTQDIVAALTQAIQQRPDWREWGEVNRGIFEERYREKESDQWLVDAVLPFLSAP